MMNDQGHVSTKSFFNKSASKLVATVLILPMLAVNPAFAANKEDKAFESCLAKCVFQETKPPPLGASVERLEVTRPRGEILRDCKKQCATKPEQLLLGKPKVKASINDDQP
eukprot:gene26593-32140_t